MSSSVRSNRRAVSFWKLRSLLALTALFAIPLQLAGQQAIEADPRAEEIVRRAIEALGGSSYLNIQTVVSKGFYTTYQEGVSQVPARFLDYIVYPDRERTEFTGGGIRVIQTNSGETGWVFDGAVKVISDMKPEQVEDFKRSMRTSVENLLRGWWRKEGATLAYIGRREAGLAKRNETVRLTYPNGFWIEYEFGARDHLPAKVIYKRNRTNPDSGEMEETTEEDRLARLITIDGINVPWVVDHYTNKVQTRRINYESVEFNRPVPDALFVKPESVKEIK